MPLLTSYSLNTEDEPTLQQLQIYLQHLSQDKKAAIAMTAIYEATEPSAVDFDHVCDFCPKFNKVIALLQDLSKPGLLAVARAITEELAVLEQLHSCKPMKPQKCPFCRSRVSLIDSAKIYGQSYGFIYLCNAYPNCDARVRCHPRTIIPMGTLADKQLRRWRSLAHRKFDPLWKLGVFPSRQAAYKWLSKVMSLPLERTHVAMFDVRQCQRAITLVESFAKDRQRIKTKAITH